MNKEFERFDATLRGVLKVTHAEMNAKLEEEKAEKKKKKEDRNK